MKKENKKEPEKKDSKKPIDPKKKPDPKTPVSPDKNSKALVPVKPKKVRTRHEVL